MVGKLFFGGWHVRARSRTALFPLQPVGGLWRRRSGGNFAEVKSIGRNGIARLNTNATLDVSFNPGTGVVAPINPAVHSVVLQPDGNVILGGPLPPSIWPADGTSPGFMVTLLYSIPPISPVATSACNGPRFPGGPTACSSELTSVPAIGWTFCRILWLPPTRSRWRTPNKHEPFLPGDSPALKRLY